MIPVAKTELTSADLNGVDDVANTTALDRASEDDNKAGVQKAPLLRDDTKVTVAAGQAIPSTTNLAPTATIGSESVSSTNSLPQPSSDSPITDETRVAAVASHGPSSEESAATGQAPQTAEGPSISAAPSHSTRPDDDTESEWQTRASTLSEFGLDISQLQCFAPLPLEDPWNVVTSRPEWLSLLTDLVVASTLNIFGGTHQLVNPDAIVNFLGYYTIIVFMWFTQTQYDLRYQYSDFWHLCLRAIQLILFMYIGAASGGWNLSTWLNSQVTKPYEKVERSLSHSAFQVTALAVLAHRVLLAVQYLVIGYRSQQSFEPTHQVEAKGLLLRGSSSIFSMTAFIIASALPSSSKELIIAKIAMLYIGVTLELVAHFIVEHKWPLAEIGEEISAARYGSLTLLVLGEAFINIGRALHFGFYGASFVDSTLHVHVFLVVCILVCLWLNLHDSPPGSFHVGWRKEVDGALLYPHLFCILLFMAGLANSLSVPSFGRTFPTNIQDVVTALSQLNGTAMTEGLSDTRLDSVAAFVDRLSVTPEFAIMYKEIAWRGTVVDELSFPPDEIARYRNETTLIVLQYVGNIMQRAAISAELQISEAAHFAYQDLLQLPPRTNITQGGPATTQDVNRTTTRAATYKNIIGTVTAMSRPSAAQAARAGNYVDICNTLTKTVFHETFMAVDALDTAQEKLAIIWSEIYIKAYSGILWVFPAAGITLSMSAIRFLLRYQRASAFSKLNRVKYIHMFVVGGVLAVLGALNRGTHAQFPIMIPSLAKLPSPVPDYSPIYNLADRLGIVPIVFGVYLYVIVVHFLPLRWVRRRILAETFDRQTHRTTPQRVNEEGTQEPQVP